MAKNFKTLRENMRSEARERAHRLAAKYRAEMPLDELREARNFTQQEIADLLRVNQAAVSKLESRVDMYLSTLRRFVEAMGGELVICARFSEGDVRIKQFEALEERTNTRDRQHVQPVGV